MGGWNVRVGPAKKRWKLYHHGRTACTTVSRHGCPFSAMRCFFSVCFSSLGNVNQPPPNMCRADVVVWGCIASMKSVLTSCGGFRDPGRAQESIFETADAHRAEPAPAMQ
jgi:hypothetical protein